MVTTTAVDPMKLRRCPTCGSLHKQHDDIWTAWFCTYCPAPTTRSVDEAPTPTTVVCNQPVLHGPGACSTPCYVLHLQTAHPDIYRRSPPPDAGAPA